MATCPSHATLEGISTCLPAPQNHAVVSPEPDGDKCLRASCLQTSCYLHLQTYVSPPYQRLSGTTPTLSSSTAPSTSASLRLLLSVPTL